MKLDKVIFRQDLYPRFEPNQQMIERYALSIEMLPPIKINQDNILIDGFHRWKAHQLAKCEDIQVEVIKTESEAKLEILAYQFNSNHGLQLAKAEKQAFAQKKIGILSVGEVAKILSVHQTTVNEWTKTQRAAQKKERNRRVIEEYLRAWNTLENVVKLIPDLDEITPMTVKNICSTFYNSKEFLKIINAFDPFIYATWNIPKADWCYNPI